MASRGGFKNIVNAAFKFRRIPDKWKDYVACGKPITRERLVAFKTPLSEEYHYTGNGDEEDSLLRNEEFTPNDLCKTINDSGPVLGLVLDFTNTKRYYNPEELTNKGIEYKKIKCEGKIVPPEHVVKRFKVAILSYLKRFPTRDSLVGVHCTHGLNRAGYIVCRYLIDCKGYTPNTAIDAFNKARGYDMERESYIEDLMQRTPKLLSDVDVDSLLRSASPCDHGKDDTLTVKPRTHNSADPAHRIGDYFRDNKRDRRNTEQFNNIARSRKTFSNNEVEYRETHCARDEEWYQHDDNYKRGYRHMQLSQRYEPYRKPRAYEDSYRHKLERGDDQGWGQRYQRGGTDRYRSEEGLEEYQHGGRGPHRGERSWDHPVRREPRRNEKVWKQPGRREQQRDGRFGERPVREEQHQCEEKWGKQEYPHREQHRHQEPSRSQPRYSKNKRINNEK